MNKQKPFISLFKLMSTSEPQIHNFAAPRFEVRPGHTVTRLRHGHDQGLYTPAGLQSHLQNDLKGKLSSLCNYFCKEQKVN